MNGENSIDIKFPCGRGHTTRAFIRQETKRIKMRSQNKVHILKQ